MPNSEQETLVLNVLLPNVGLSTEEVAESISTSYGTAYNILSYLKNKGQVIQTKKGRNFYWLLGKSELEIIVFPSLNPSQSIPVSIWQVAENVKYPNFTFRASKLWNSFPRQLAQLYGMVIRLENKQLVRPQELTKLRKELLFTRQSLVEATTAIDRLMGHPLWNDIKLLKGALTGGKQVTIDQIKELLTILENRENQS